MQSKASKKEGRKDASWRSRIKFLPLSIGFFWFIIGVGVATSSRISPKILQWRYILAWIILFGLPCLLLFRISIRRIPKTSTRRVAAISKSSGAKQEPVLETDNSVKGVEVLEYKEALAKLMEEEPELRETQKVEEDLEEGNYAQQSESQPEKSVEEAQCTCEHLNVMQIPVFNVRGEIRRVVRKCADCGAVLETENIGR